MKKLNNIKTKLTAKAMTTAFRAKEAFKNDSGMELLQVLIIALLAVGLGTLLYKVMTTQFNAQLTTVGNKMTDMLK